MGLTDLCKTYLDELLKVSIEKLAVLQVQVLQQGQLGCQAHHSWPLHVKAVAEAHRCQLGQSMQRLHKSITHHEI